MAMARKKPPVEGIDSLLGELDAMSAAPPPPPPVLAAADDDLDSLLDDLGVFDAAAEDQPAVAPPPPATDCPAAAGAALPSPRPLRRRRVLSIAAVLASHAALLGLGYWLGSMASGHAPVAAAAKEPPRLEGVLRYVGQQADARVDGEVIFTSPEVREAVLELAGGQALADAMTRFSRSLRSLGPVTRHGELVEASACNPAACEHEAYRLRYDQHSGQVWVCQTAQFTSGASLSYLYDAEGMQEVSHCVGAPPLARPAPATEAAEPSEAADAEAPDAAPEHGSTGHAAGD